MESAAPIMAAIIVTVDRMMMKKTIIKMMTVVQA